ncbi:hypothetical protein BH10ACI3_BH10ACI3_12840 [soil metagenome]
MRAVLLITFVLFFCYSASAQTEPTPAAPGVEEVYLAKDNGEGKAGDQATEFKTTDVPIYCVVLLENSAKTTVKMNFVAVNVNGVKADTKVVTATYTTKENQNRVNFSGRPDEKWTPGTYRVDLFLDGKLVKGVEFKIKGPGGDSTAVKYFKDTQSPKAKPKTRPVKNQ